MSTPEFSHAVRHGGNLRLDVRHDGRQPEPLPDRGFRQKYWYRITDTTNPGRQSVEGTDLRSGVGDPPDVNGMVRTLASFLVAAGEAYEYTMRHPSTPSDNLELFGSWVPEAAYENSDELTLLTVEPDPDEEQASLNHELGPASRQQAARTGLFERWEDLPEPVGDPELGFLLATESDEPASTWPPGRYFDVLFLQDSEGYEVCDLIDDRGVDAAIEHLAQWDYGEETLNAAVFNGHVHDDAPTHPGDRTAVSGSYTLVYNLNLGHVALLKEFTAGDVAPAGWPNETTTPSRSLPAAERPGRPGRSGTQGGPGGPAAQPDSGPHPGGSGLTGLSF